MDPTTLDPTLVLQLIALVQRVPYVGPLVVWLPLVCTAASILDAALPPPPAGSMWVWPRRVDHLLALSWGWARNAIPAGAVPASVAAKASETKAAADDALVKAGELKAAVQEEAAGVPVGLKGEPVSKWDPTATRALR